MMLALKPILDALPYGIIVTDPTLRLEIVNTWLQDKYPGAPLPRPGQPLEEAFPEFKNHGVLAAVEQVKQNGQPCTLSARLHPDGCNLSVDSAPDMESRPLSITLIPVFEEKQLAQLLIVIQDITDHVRTETELQIEIHKLTALQAMDQAYHQAINDFSGDIIYTVDTDLRLTSANDAWDHFARENGGEAWLSSKMIGRSLLEAFSGAEREKWASITRQLLLGELELYREDLPCLTSHRECWYNQFATALRDSNQQVIGLIFLTREITHLVQIENQARSTNFRLGTLIAAINLMSEQQQNTAMMLESVIWLIADVFKAESICYFQISEEDEAIENVVVIDHSPDQVGLAPLSYVGLNEVIHVLEITGILADASPLIQDPAEIFSQYSALYAMVCTRSKTVGGILLLSQRQKSTFTIEQKEILAAIAQQLGLYLENAELYTEQQRLAKTDSLTGLHNRRRMLEELEIEIRREARYHRPLSLLMVDIDNFKRFNDSFGHPIGDKLLVKMASILKMPVRATDLVARYGGEEFVILLPETDMLAACMIAERVRQSVAAEAASVIWSEAPEYRVTVSIGVATAPLHGKTPEALLRAADFALYQAKYAGKNQVMVAQQGE